MTIQAFKYLTVRFLAGIYEKSFVSMYEGGVRVRKRAGVTDHQPPGRSTSGGFFVLGDRIVKEERSI